LSDVENALGLLRHLDEQQTAQTESLAQSERAFEGTQLRYREGSVHLLAVFEAQRTLHAIREQASQYKLNRLQALLSLSKALGGGWRPSAADTAKRQ